MLPVHLMKKEEGRKLKKIVDPGSVRMQCKRNRYMFLSVCMYVCSSYYRAKLTSLGVDYSIHHHYTYTCTHLKTLCRRHDASYIYIRIRWRNIMSRHITNSKKDISLPNLSTNLKKNEGRKRKGQQKLLLFS